MVNETFHFNISLAVCFGKKFNHEQILICVKITNSKSQVEII